MRFNDPSRPQLALGRPCWREAPGLTLPELAFRPTSATGVFLMILVGGGFWRAREVKGEEVLGLLREWGEGPEDFLERHWGMEAPKSLASSWSSAAIVQPTATKVIAKSAEELGF